MPAYVYFIRDLNKKKKKKKKGLKQRPHVFTHLSLRNVAANSLFSEDLTLYPL